jgi:hypothetical protein
MTTRYEIPTHIEIDDRGQLWMVDDWHPLEPGVQPMRLLLWPSCKAPPLPPFRPERRGPAQRDLFA